MTNLSNLNKMLAVFIAFISAMIICPIAYTGSTVFIFLWWNLFLAWVPLRLAMCLRIKEGFPNWKAAILLVAWLLFFPNALYLVTDLIHIDSNGGMPAWYKALLLFTAAIAGLLMAFGSLYKVEAFFNRQIGRSATRKLIFFCLFAGSFGVYLGRFLRWNSWDVMTDPLELLKEIAVRCIFPMEHYRTWAVTLLFTAFFYLLYFTVKELTVYGMAAKRMDVPDEQ